MKKLLRPTVVFAAIGFAIGAGALAVSAQDVSPLPTVPGYALPADLAGGHFLVEPGVGSPIVAADQAIATARSEAAGLAASPTGVSAQFVLFTDRNRGTVAADGSLTLSFKSVPAWIVRFTGVPQPVFGRLGVGSQAPRPAQELNVIVDARSGAYLEMFSFQ